MSVSLLEIAQLRELEEKYARILGPDVLMQRAGKAAAEYIRELHPETCTVTVICGPGNNGGDGYVCAKILSELGHQVSVVNVGGKTPKTEQAKEALAAWEATGATIYTDPYDTPKAQIVVDALFGIGQTRALVGEYLDAAMWFNERRALHVSLDIPTGLDAQTGNWVGGRAGCRADATITFLSGKPGLYTSIGKDACGAVQVENLGISIPLTKINLTEVKDFKHVCASRTKNTSKADYGRVGVIGGGKGTVGAALIAARSALYMGAGRVYVELVEEKMDLDPSVPELMFRDKLDLSEMDAVVIGCGLGFSEKAKARFIECLQSDAALVIDADALTMVAGDEELLSLVTHRRAHTVITPHNAEAARILGCPLEEITADRLNRALDLSVLTGAVTVLKGAGTIVCQRSSISWINPTGTPALATAGSGDALSGMIAAMFAQRYELMDCVLSAVYLHGLAAEGCDSGILASDIAPTAAEFLQALRDSYREHFHPLRERTDPVSWED